MKKLIKGLKIRVKNNLIIKLAKTRKENKYLKEKLTASIINERAYIDEINNYKRTIREMKLNAR